MSMPIRELDSYGFVAFLQQKKSNKIPEQENDSCVSRAEIIDLAIEDRDVKHENEGCSDLERKSLERVPELEQLEAKIEEENAMREEEADEAKAFTASYINNPSSPGNIINVTA